VAPLHGASAAHHHARAASGELDLSEAAPVGDDGETIDDLNEGGVVGGQRQVGWQANPAAALSLTGSRWHVLHGSGGCWQRAFDQS
jgi:hypothetical protein